MKTLAAAAFASAVVFVFLAVTPTEAAIQLEFDYTYDTYAGTGFFNLHPEAKATLDAACDFYALILADDLLTIEPSDGLTGYTFQPNNPGSILYLPNLNVAADTVKIYIGTYDYDDNILGQGGPGGYAQFFNSAMARGEGAKKDVQGPTATEFAPWGGAISIDSDTPWNLDYTADTAWNEIDLYSVIVHELGHVLGIGTADSWYNLISGSYFYGAAARAKNGGAAVPVSVSLDGGDHWQDNTQSTVFGGYDAQEASMTPYINWGSRKFFTALDAAGLDDIGWDINYPLGAYGDANLDGTVDELDATIMATNWLRVDAEWSQGDFSGDGTVDGEDAALLATNWLRSSGGYAANVPEPGGGGLLLSLLAAIFLPRKQP